MDPTLQKHGAKHIYKVPEGLRELCSDISREVSNILLPNVKVVTCLRAPLSQFKNSIQKFMQKFLKLYINTSCLDLTFQNIHFNYPCNKFQFLK